MVATTCPINEGQMPYRRLLLRGSETGIAPSTASIPASTADLQSIIRTVNAITSVLRTLTTSLTVNNVYNPMPASQRATGDKDASKFPYWVQHSVENSKGYVYHKEQKLMDVQIEKVNPITGEVTTETQQVPYTEVDTGQRAYIVRHNRITFVNMIQDDPEFPWEYSLELDFTLPE
jgi:hypothetical protein